MKDMAKLLRLLSDPTRLRILMLLTRKELCVCQVMGVLGISQPLVSRNLNLLSSAGFLRERKDGKLVFYALMDRLPQINEKVISFLKDSLSSDRLLAEDLESLGDCAEFQKKTGKCDMKTFREFMESKRRRQSKA